jgi:hypothetical protein
VATAVWAADVDARLKQVREQFGPPVMWVPRPAAPPKIDGKLDDAAWAAARPVTLGYVVDGWDMPTQKTTARVLADKRAMYFAVRCREAHPDQVRAVDRGDLSRRNVGDTVELFLDPLHTQKYHLYYHVIVSPKGVVFWRGGPDFGAWKANITAAAGTFEGGWQVEVAVPMADLAVGEGQVPDVWGLNICRQRPERGVVRPKAAVGRFRFRPSIRPLDEPDKYRDGEYSAWAPTWDDFSYLDSRPFHHPTRFGHAVLEVGTKRTRPPAKVFEVLYKSNFDAGQIGPMSDREHEGGGVLVDESFRGAGKSFTSRTAEKRTLFLRKPLRNLQDATLIMTFRMLRDGRMYYYGRAPDFWQCGAHRHEVFLTKEAAAARAAVKRGGYSLFPPLRTYHTHADFAAWKPLGRLWNAPGNWALMSGYFSEPTIGSAMWPGTDWVILRTRLGVFRRFHGRKQGQKLVPRDQDYPNGLVLFASESKLLVSDLVIFRGHDVEPPEEVKGIVAKREGKKVRITWQRARDNTLTAYYQLFAGGRKLLETHRLTATVDAGQVAGKPVTVVACDLYGNSSRP